MIREGISGTLVVDGVADGPGRVVALVVEIQAIRCEGEYGAAAGVGRGLRRRDLRGAGKFVLPVEGALSQPAHADGGAWARIGLQGATRLRYRSIRLGNAKLGEAPMKEADLCIGFVAGGGAWDEEGSERNEEERERVASGGGHSLLASRAEEQRSRRPAGRGCLQATKMINQTQLRLSDPKTCLRNSKLVVMECMRGEKVERGKGPTQDNAHQGFEGGFITEPLK